MISVVITTYNRPEKCLELVSLIKKEDAKALIIVVDSGDKKFTIDTKQYNNVNVVESKHKNQPFQRFLGYHHTKTDWILYLDDDMEPLESTFKVLNELITEKGNEFGLFALKFMDKHQNSFIKNQKESVLKSSRMATFFRVFSGYPILPEGIYGRNGVKGIQPKQGGRTYHSGGGAFLVKKEYLYQNFNMQLFDLYESRKGKGEDGILSYTVSKQTNLYYYPKQLFWHNDQANSVYTKNEKQFNKIVAYSRLYLNLEYARLNNKSIFLARLSYLWYSKWRIFGLLINSILRPSKINWNRLKGYVTGVLMALGLNYKKKLENNSYWINELN